MKKIILASCAILAASFATQAGAQQGTVNGAAGGAVTGEAREGRASVGVSRAEARCATTARTGVRSVAR